MKQIDFITTVLLILGLIWGTCMLILFRRDRSKPEKWPHILGIGTGVFGFISLMTASILLRPISEFVDYTITNFFWSLAGGLVGYVSGRIFAHRLGK